MTFTRSFPHAQSTAHAMRPLIQYDLDEHPTTPGPSTSMAGPHANANTDASAYRPPVKKRKRGHYNPAAHVQHWDDPGSAITGVVYDEHEAGASAVMSYEGEGDEGAGVEAEEGGEEEEEESRLLVHEEIWDDSALIDAWNSAEAEYEAYHGASKTWKTEPVKKSPLWYNKPYVAPPPKPGPSKPKPLPSKVQPQVDGGPEPDTTPLDFDTYVPTHDPSLAAASTQTAPTATSLPFFVSPPSTATASRDEAFNNAMSAMYWSGYWTAVYHCQSQVSEKSKSGDGPAEDGAEADQNQNEDDEDQDLVPTQR